MGKKSDKPKANQDGAQSGEKSEPAVLIRLPFVEDPEGQFPGHPRNLELALSPARRRRLMAIYAGLQAAGATVLVGRGGTPVEMPVTRLADVFYYLLDNAVPAEQAVPAVPAVPGQSTEK
ncbi:MAG TPA: hypothetical protein PK280_17410 [Planctomycetota bacterium]|nr:hypothetical protein [Planctomycetota bacterium]